jgi:hypothetical protein
MKNYNQYNEIEENAFVPYLKNEDELAKSGYTASVADTYEYTLKDDMTNEEGHLGTQMSVPNSVFQRH